MSGLPLRVTLPSGTRKTLNDRFTQLQANTQKIQRQRSRNNSASSQVSVGRGSWRGGAPTFIRGARGFGRGRGRGTFFRGRGGGGPPVFNNGYKRVMQGRVERRGNWRGGDSSYFAVRGSRGGSPIRGRGRGRGSPRGFFPRGGFGRGGQSRGRGNTRGRGRGSGPPAKKEDLDSQLDNYMQNTTDSMDYFTRAKMEDNF